MIFNNRNGSGSGNGRGRRSGGGMGKNRTNAGLGGGGMCVCTSCGSTVNHQRGVPCYEMKCPDCDSPMTRDGLVDRKEGVKKPSVIESKCVGCARCVNVCPYEAITMTNGKAVIDQHKCVGCGQCISSCPVNAIK